MHILCNVTIACYAVFYGSYVWSENENGFRVQNIEWVRSTQPSDVTFPEFNHFKDLKKQRK